MVIRLQKSNTENLQKNSQNLCAIGRLSPRSLNIVKHSKNNVMCYCECELPQQSMRDTLIVSNSSLQ